MTQVVGSVGLAPGSDSDQEPVECDWKICAKTHTATVDYPKAAKLAGDSKVLSNNLAAEKKTPWGMGRLAMIARDRKRFLGRPQWSYPGDEDYFLSAKKSNIEKRIKEGKITASDLPPSILALMQDPTVKGGDLIALNEHPTPPKIAKHLNSKNCIPWRSTYSNPTLLPDGTPRVMRPHDYPVEAHHLLSEQFFGGGAKAGDYPELNANAELVGYDVNCHENGINLPRFPVDVVCHGLPQHEGNHNATDYNRSVGKLLAAVQKWSLKQCKTCIGGKPTSQMRLIQRLHRASGMTYEKITQWHKGFMLRTDNHQVREEAYRRIKTMLLFDQIQSGYPPVPVSETR